MRRRALLAGLAAVSAAAAGGPARAAEEKKKGGGLSYLQLPTLTADVLRSGGRRGVMTVEAGIDTPDKALRAQVDLMVPRLLDAYRAVLADFAAGLRPGGLPDVEALVRSLQAATDRVMGRPGCRFLIGTVLTP